MPETQGVPKYRHVANVLRERIRSGELPPGSAFPPEPELEAEFGYHRGTIRAAVRILRREGLLDVRQGRKTLIRQQRLIRRNIIEGLRLEYNAVDGPPPPDLFQAMTGTAGDPEVDCAYQVIDTDPELAELFSTGRTGQAYPPPAKLLCRRYFFRIDGAPHQVATSYLPLDLVAGTPLMDEANETRGRGTMAQLADIGIRIDHVFGETPARLATLEEADLLGMEEGLPVFDMQQVMYAEDRPVVVWRTIAACDRLILEYCVDFISGGS